MQHEARANPFFSCFPNQCRGKIFKYVNLCKVYKRSVAPLYIQTWQYCILLRKCDITQLNPLQSSSFCRLHYNRNCLVQLCRLRKVKLDQSRPLFLVSKFCLQSYDQIFLLWSHVFVMWVHVRHENLKHYPYEPEELVSFLLSDTDSKTTKHKALLIDERKWHCFCLL